jgi:hypothetical protein
VSQALADWVTARHDALASALETLASEYRLSDEHSSVLALGAAERGMDAAAKRLADAVDALPSDRRPAGWGDPPATAGVLKVSRRRFITVALRCLSAEYAPESAHADAESEYAGDQLAHAARNLAADIDAHRAATTRGDS